MAVSTKYSFGDLEDSITIPRCPKAKRHAIYTATTLPKISKI